MTLRLAENSDAPSIGRLHAASWRAHYRGNLTDAYLDGPVEDERRLFWQARLKNLAPSQVTVLAEIVGEVAGFVCALVNDDPEWGTLIDNLHVTGARQKSGIGRALMHDIAERLVEIAPNSPVHLFVIEPNTGARAFYARIDGHQTGVEVGAMPDGSVVPGFRIVWSSPQALHDATL